MLEKRSSEKKKGNSKRTRARERIAREKRTWIEIDARACEENIAAFRRIAKPGSNIWSVVKSNAYGHGIEIFSRIAERGGADGFCVDSVIEGYALRKFGIGKPILVLGPTLPAHFERAARAKIVISVAGRKTLEHLRRVKTMPAFHIKIDTGMHRRGFASGEVTGITKIIQNNARLRAACEGIFTHFSSAKDIRYPTYTERQFEAFEAAAVSAETMLGKKLFRHAAATGGTMMDARYHADAVRIGIGLYGIYPSRELELTHGSVIRLLPALGWYATVSEIREIPKGSFVGYDGAERTVRRTHAAVIPVGYWHGIPRSLSGVGEVLIRGKRARILGRVSMDLVVADVTGVSCREGDIVTIIGEDRGEVIRADEAALRAGTTAYEFVTRVNPLIERIVV